MRRTRLRGASAGTVRSALRTRDPLPGTRGFAGHLASDDAADGDPIVVRDVLGRQPVFTEADDPTAWAFEPAALDDPTPVPGGHVRRPAGDEQIWSLPDSPAETDRDAAVESVASAVTRSVRETDPDGLAVAFSGGVDSALVAAGVPDAPCYVAGFPGAHDIEAAREAAGETDRDLRVVELDHDDLRAAVPEVAAATGRTNPMDVQIALPLYLTAKRAAADGFDRLAVGQGADELFGGYAKVARAPDDPRVDADTVRGATREVVASLPDQLERDVLALRAAGVEPVAPLLHDRVVAAALPLPGDLLVDPDRDERKVALRRAAVASGLVSHAVAARDKKAVQYGTYASRELDRLARRAGFKRRMDDHVGKYVRSLCETDGRAN